MAPSIEIARRLVAELVDRKPIVLNGAGLSSNLVSMTTDLEEQIPQILEKLSLPHEEKSRLRDSIGEISNIDSLKYHKKARKIVDCLERNIDICGFNNIQDDSLRAKTQFLHYLDFHGKQAWLGEIELSNNKNFARYQVIARLAKEDSWSSIFTTNWDYFLERALEQIGMQLNTDEISAPLTPWKSCFTTYLHHGQETALQHKVVIYKIHGCARELKEGFEEYDRDPEKLESAVSRFMILDNEIEELIGRECAEAPSKISSTDKALVDKFRDKIREHPLWIMGKSLNDKYLIKLIEQAEPRNSQFAVMDVEWNHDMILDFFKKQKQQCFFELTQDEPWKWDNCLLWLQTCYGLNRLKQNLQGNPDGTIRNMAENIGNMLEDLIGFEGLQVDGLLFDFFDKFLPAWARLVWRSGMVECLNFYIEDIRMEAPDLYIPLQTSILLRPDLVSGSQILLQLKNNAISSDLKKYPGGLWDDKSGRLFLPIPVKNGETGNLIEGFERHIKLFKYEKGFINNIIIVPIDLDNIDPDFEINDDIKKKIEKSFYSWGISINDKIDFKTLNELIFSD